MTSAERQHYGRLAALGCIACHIQGTPGTAAEIHHARGPAGAGQKSDYRYAIPLCPVHHRGTAHPEHPSIHLDKARFIERFGTEGELIAMAGALIFLGAREVA